MGSGFDKEDAEHEGLYAGQPFECTQTQRDTITRAKRRNEWTERRRGDWRRKREEEVEERGGSQAQEGKRHARKGRPKR